MVAAAAAAPSLLCLSACLSTDDVVESRSIGCRSIMHAVQPWSGANRKRGVAAQRMDTSGLTHKAQHIALFGGEGVIGFRLPLALVVVGIVRHTNGWKNWRCA